jgi:hypothetical protein
MPVEMTDEELESALASSTQIDDYDYRNEDSEDDYYSLALYQTNDDLHFRLLLSSGFDSRYMGSMNGGIWLQTDEEVKNWRDY